jgi:hypothetical protein
MKKYYDAPCTEMTTITVESLLTTVSADDISHGGTDDGTHEADSRHYDVWDSEDE